MNSAPKPALYALTPEAHAAVMIGLGLLQGQHAAYPARAMLSATYAHGPVIPSDYNGIEALRASLDHTGLDLPAIAALLGADKSYVLVQEGGASNELYLHAHQSAGEAEADRVNCALDGAYRTSPVVEVSAVLAAVGEDFYTAIESILQANRNLACVNGFYTIQLAPPDGQEGTSATAERVWYFDTPEARNECRELAVSLGLDIVEDSAVMPEDHKTDWLSDFREYAKQQVQAKAE
jgi:hypothetical protein